MPLSVLFGGAADSGEAVSLVQGRHDPSRDRHADDDTGFRDAGPGQIECVPDPIEIEVARAADRDDVIRALAARGFSPRVLELDRGFGVEIPCDDDRDCRCADALHELDQWVAETGAMLVPELADGRIFLRPPAA